MSLLLGDISWSVIFVAFPGHTHLYYGNGWWWGGGICFSTNLVKSRNSCKPCTYSTLPSQNKEAVFYFKTFKTGLSGIAALKANDKT